MHRNLRNKMIVLPEILPRFLPVLVLTLVVLSLPACSSSLHSPWTRTLGQIGATSEQAGRQLGTPAPNQDGILKVLVYHDMEGLSGQSDWRTFSYRYQEQYQIGRELLVGDVNAVVAGLFDGGADVVHVVDAHGSGNPQPDIPTDKLDSRAQMVFRDRPFRQYVDLVEPQAYDAIAVVGMHAKTGSGGFASHTYTLGMDIIMNGMSVTETEIIGYSWGRVDVPVIFASGDDKLAHDLQTMPWIQYVTVKKATSASTVELIPLEEARKNLRLGARRAIEDLASAKTMKLTAPIKAALRAVHPASLASLDGVPGIDYEDNTVTFSATDFLEAYDGVIALIQVARAGYDGILQEVIAEHADANGLRDANYARLFERWLDVESGRWSSPPPSSRRQTARRYHGAR